ncbi:hypothetical protein TCAL_12300 [Tigriopus californicus]|uniref:MORN repeat-containing protein 5 n=1 Tax=Tigriopus californicus TaxID=6832 RepID=A0A553NCJ0_TIGCA|nr:radial spoke head 10 homolog B-like [Tigriopus californicus]TRY63135.1 hypothetical protein TCAL_12300 [Tigriopus californicus]|eukprot:TCALIF_12300-PA protein Name:"Similar to PIP5K1 Phosphatidylinositol 4-phosphate 5-kinase 1 (Arabidopsis thaliana)" AED:0.04 eAED:0.04 QI:120/1/0.8/1/1/1/5/158/337
MLMVSSSRLTGDFLILRDLPQVFFMAGLLLHVDWIQGQQRLSRDVFRAEIFLRDKSGLNNGLYEGFVNGRRRFGGTQVPEGFGVINYFSDDKFHRLNYTGEWFNGVRSGNGTTFFRDGSVYTGDYKDGVEDGRGEIRYSNGNVLRGEFRRGKIDGTATFTYPNGNQRQGVFLENILDGEVVFTEANGRTTIEIWNNGKRIEDNIVSKGNSDPETSMRSKFNDPNHFQPSLPFPNPKVPTTTSTTPSPPSVLGEGPEISGLSLFQKVIRDRGDPGESFFFGSPIQPGSDREPKANVVQSPADVNDSMHEAKDEFDLLREASQRDDQSVLRAFFMNVNS